MKAIIPVAGAGTRLRPLTYSKPKALLPVGSKPIIAHIVDSLIPLGCDSLVLIISPGGESISRFIEKNYPTIKVESVIQENPKGLGHAVSLAKDTVHKEDIVVVYGDTIIDGDLSEITDCKADGLIAVKEVDDPRRFGVVNISDGFITELEEKPSVPRSNLAIIGCNYFKSPDLLFQCLDEIIEKDIKTRGEYQITDAFQLMIERGQKLKAMPIEGWFDCGTPQALLETNRYMLSKERKEIIVSGSVIIPPVSIPENATVTQSIIGPYVSIGSGSIIEHSIISDSIIGAETTVKNMLLVQSLIGDNAKIKNKPKKMTIGDNSGLDFGVNEY
ncbi:MAG: NTP transferase domain-containing protein [Candidatus Latescibacteria bacterium]|nr:NTP transferase domain-containing protein [Candidatus Latescibacterota bacterium]